MFLLLKELLQPDGLPAPTHPLGRGVFNETPSHVTIRNEVFLIYSYYVKLCITVYLYSPVAVGWQG